MTCSVMLDRMLEVDLDELSGKVETPLSLHLLECARCRTVADRLVRDTHGLARAVQHSNAPVLLIAPRVRLRARSAVIVGVAAAVAFIVIRAGSGGKTPADGKPVVKQPATVSSPAARTVDTRRLEPAPTKPSEPTDRVARPTGRTTARGRAIAPLAVTVERTWTSPIERAVSFRPVRLDPIPAVPTLGDGVQVDPPAGKRATILRSDQPGVTVVWLYD